MPYIAVTAVYPNTVMQKYVTSAGVERAYKITPVEGYVIHDNRKDYLAEDNETVILGYGYLTSVPITYDFEANEYEIYAVLESEVPADQIFNVTDKPVTE